MSNRPEYNNVGTDTPTVAGIEEIVMQNVHTSFGNNGQREWSYVLYIWIFIHFTFMCVYVLLGWMIISGIFSSAILLVLEMITSVLWMSLLSIIIAATGWKRMKISGKCTKCSCCFTNWCWILIASLFPFVAFLATLLFPLFYLILWDITDYSCLVFGLGIIWINPLVMLISFVSLISEGRYLIIFYHIIAGIVALFGVLDDSICYVIKFPFITNSIMFPLYIILIFMTFPEIKRFKFDIMGMYLVAFDEVTDIIVIIYFFGTGDYLFAVIQIFCILSGNVFGAFSNNLFGEEYKALTKADKIVSLAGFGRPWFIIKSWNEVDNEENDKMYTKLQKRHEIWAIMYESFPSIVLTIYASLIAEKFSLSLIVSIVISCTTVSFNTWRYLIDLSIEEKQNLKSAIELGIMEEVNTNQLENGVDENAKITGNEIEMDDMKSNDHEKDEEEQNDTKSIAEATTKSALDIIPSPVAKEVILGNTSFYLRLFVFLVTDFYIRSIPLACFMALVILNACNADDTFCPAKLVVFIAVFGGLMVFEFIMNKRMRVKEWSSYKYVFQVFYVSIFSSFYILLSSLDILKNNQFFGGHVVFQSFVIEHKIRCVLSVILMVINLGLFGGIPDEIDVIAVVSSLIAIYIIFLIVNIWSLKRIGEVNADS